MSEIATEDASEAFGGSDALDLLRSWYGRALLVSCSVLAAYLFYLQWDEADQTVLAPALFLCLIFVVFSTQLHAREKRFPFTDIGFICATATLCYVVLPLVFYVLSGSEWTALSDARLQLLRPNQAQLATFGWEGVAYVLPLCFGYLLTRGGQTPIPLALQSPKVNEIWGVLAVFAACRAYQWAVETVYSTRLIMSNEEIASQSGIALPHIIAQFNNVILNVAMIGKIYLIVLLVRLWRRSAWIPVVVVTWLAFETYSTIKLGGPRTYLALLIFASLISYHRFVRPLSGPEAAVVGFLMMTGLLTYGHYRDFKGLDVLLPLSANNEFQVLLATALDVKRLVAAGVPIPWQVHWSEFVNFIPQQIAPFEKMDPANWYLTFLNGSSGGFMFGVMAQAEIGAGRIELIIRGILLGLVLGLINRTFARPGRSMTAAVFYIWLTMMIYHTYRATSLYVLTEALLFFVPFVVLTKIATAIFHRASNVVEYVWNDNAA